MYRYAFFLFPLRTLAALSVLLTVSALFTPKAAAREIFADCVKRCTERQQERYIRCLQQPPPLASLCTPPPAALCQTRCQQYTARVRDRERHLCIQRYIQRMRQCQDLRPPEQQACRGFAIQQKKRCLKPCLPAPAEPDVLRCLTHCSQFQSKKRFRCRRLRLMPRLRYLCEQRYREEYDRCVHLCRRPPFLSPATTQPTHHRSTTQPTSTTSRPAE